MKTYLAVFNSSCHLILLLFLLPLHCISQRQDFVWLSGYGSSFVEDTGWNSRFGINQLDFNQTPVLISHDSLGMGITNTNVSYCDTDGHILFYCNGIYIANSLDEKIENSDSMNAGYFTFQWIDPAVGNYVGQGILALKSPSEDSKFYLIHSFIDTVNANFSFGCKKILFTLLDMDANIGHGSVLQKDQVILNGSFAAELKATRHANGRDWWLLVQKRGTNCYEKILLDNTGFHNIGTTCGGQSVVGLSGSACFSQDGSKYVYVGMYGGINLFDFDRCSGNLSNPQYFPLPIFQDSGAIGIGSAFSPNSRFLYVNATIHCYQFDLWAADAWASIDTVAFYDGAQNPFGSVFHTMQIAPDGKIYSSCGNGEYVYHVIKRPDEKGDSCLFIQHGVILPAYSGGGLPNFPNYRLGALPNSPCDTLTSINDTEKSAKEKHINIFPNPATDFITVDYGFTDWNKGKADLYITNELGQIVHHQPLPLYSGLQKINITLLTAGVYHVAIKRGTQTVAVNRFAKH
jgi:hypothetical protein